MINKSKTTLALMITGSTGYASFKYLIKKYTISNIFTNSTSEKIINLAKKNYIQIFQGNPTKITNLNNLKKIFKSKPDIIFSINYPYYINKKIINYSNIISLNIHGSLLPRYKGRGPLVRAIMNGDRYTGITVHEIDQKYDSGKILIKKKMTIPSTASGYDMLKKYEIIYPLIIEKSIKLILSKKVTFQKQKELLSKPFKAISENDRIIKWQKNTNNILNQIRAFSYPFNGAIAIINNKKIIIDKATKFKMGNKINYRYGIIIKVVNKKPVLKTRDGYIMIKKYRLLK